MMARTPVASGERGFSLVELMVTLVVSLFLLAGVLQILLSNRESLQTQQSASMLQENARIAEFTIENIVAHAGYRVELGRKDLYRAGTQSYKDMRFQSDALVASGRDATSAGDAVRIRFQASADHNGCNGPEPDVTDRSVALKMVDVVLYVNDDDTLLCRDFSSNDGASAEPLVENVRRAGIAYGVDRDGDGSVDTYVDSVTAADAGAVLSVQMQLLLQTDANVLPSAQEHRFAFADGDFEVDHRRAYVFLDRVIALRNAIP